ncbi:unnamed protein product [Linum trigynum]|uniref:Uncharacterized protein n=1 Tax=Linum trigynum TaxID=586398 RepID=A0AAV2ETC5_9ROSI
MAKEKSSRLSSYWFKGQLKIERNKSTFSRIRRVVRGRGRNEEKKQRGKLRYLSAMAISGGNESGVLGSSSEDWGSARWNE